MIKSGILCLLLFSIYTVVLPQETIVSFNTPWTLPLHIDGETKFHFSNDAGKYVYIVNKTAWAYFGCENPHNVLQRAVDQGVNVIRVALEGKPYFAELGKDLWP